MGITQTIEANKYIPNSSGGATIQTVELNLADIASGAVDCDYITIHIPYIASQNKGIILAGYVT